MSGVTSSQRQWMSKRVRALAASILALAMLIPLFSMAHAQTQPEPYAGTNQMCITGTVINFDETLIDEPWEVTATLLPGGPTYTTTLDDGKFEFKGDPPLGLPPGVWEVSLTLPQNWEPVLPYGTSFEVNLGYGNKDCVEVRFKVKRPVPVEVLKIDDNHVPLADWVIRAAPASDNWFASPITAATDISGTANFRLTEGNWIFTEQPPDHQKFMPVMPSNGKQEVDVDWDTAQTNGGKISIRFKNRLFFKGCIAVTKTDAPPDPNMPAYGLPGWKITVTRTDGTIAAEGYTDAQGNVRFDNLVYGPYIVTEESRVGWDAVGAKSYQVVVSRPQTDAPDNDGCEQVGFINRQNPPGFSIEGYKIDHNGMIGIPGWIMTATAVYAGDYPDPNVDFDPISLEPIKYLTTTTDGTGKYVFTFPRNDYRIPGAAYKICEEQRAGWLPHTAVCQTVYLPHKPGAPVKAWNFVNQQVGHWEKITHPSSSSSGSGSCSTTHVVTPGQSLYGIGAYYGVSPSAMLAANPWVYSRPNYYVYPGDTVCIP
jgi:hypothetical protein